MRKSIGAKESVVYNKSFFKETELVYQQYRKQRLLILYAATGSVTPC